MTTPRAEDSEEMQIAFLRAKADGRIPPNTGWAEWCWRQAEQARQATKAMTKVETEDA